MIHHAEATIVDVSLHTSDSQLVLTVRDNGVVLKKQDAESISSLGLIGIHEHAIVLEGNVQIEAVKEGGTQVTLSLPYSEVVT